jgi:hypothetical protein
MDWAAGTAAGGIPMCAANDSTTPPRSGLRRLITPWEYRHLHAVAGLRFVGGGFTLGIGTVLLSLGRQAGAAQERRKCYGWGSFFLVIAALQLLGGGLDMILARSAPPRS